MDHCHYDVMGLDLNSTPEDVKRAYKKLAMKMHPDKNIGNEARAEHEFKELSAAYEVLSDPNARAHYNAIYKDTFAEVYESEDSYSSSDEDYQSPQQTPSPPTHSTFQETSDYEGYFFCQQDDQTDEEQKSSGEYFENDGDFDEDFMAFCRGNNFGYVRVNTSTPYDIHAMYCEFCKAGRFCIHRVQAEYPHEFVSPPCPTNYTRGDDVHISVEFTLEDFFHGGTKNVKVYAGDLEATGGMQMWYKMMAMKVEPGTKGIVQERFQNAIKTTKGVTSDVVITAELQEHDCFLLEGNDLIYDMPHSEWSNCEDYYTTIDTIDGELLTVDTPSPGNLFDRSVVQGAGMPISVGSSERGDLIVRFCDISDYISD